MTMLDTLERTFINRFQGGFPLAERPFLKVAAQLGVTEATLIQTIDRLLQRGCLSRFGPLYDAARLGGGLTLAALAVPEPRFDAVAEMVNALPGVAHNYRREHALNMWFVVAADSPDGVVETLASVRQLTGLPVYDFPKQREFYLGLWLQLAPDGTVQTVPAPRVEPAPAQPLDALDRAIIAATQAGLPLVGDPWAKVAQAVDAAAPTVLASLQRMLATGVMRRLGAVPNHYRLGLRGNGMTVWDVPDERAAELGAAVGGLDFVSHCYLRPRHPGVWPYNLFAMVHGMDRAAVAAKAAQIAALLGAAKRGHAVLLSSAVLKKTGLRIAA